VKHQACALPVVTVEWAPIPLWCAISGFGRSKTYEYIARGRLRAKKLDNRTLIHVPSGLAFMASLPDARITTGLSKAAHRGSSCSEVG
jgi:hypothetical protein